MVHAAFRVVAQGDVAKQIKLPPEEISSHNLSSLLAFTSIKLVDSEFLFERVCNANRRINLKRPSLRELLGTVVSSKYLRVQRRREMRTQREYGASGNRSRGFEELGN